jgi:ribonuclease BN (tRNA processing enzyme)
MRIKFLGTSHGAPTPGRHCQSVLIETEQGDYLFDAGAPVMDIFANDGYDVARLKAVFISHCHPDHFFGLTHMIDMAYWCYGKMRFGVYMPEQRGIDGLRTFCGAFHPLTDRVSYQMIQEGLFLDDGNIKVTAVHSDHMKASTNVCYGFLIEGEGSRVYITGDLHPSLEDFPVQLLSEPVDALITECAHFSAEELVQKLLGVNARRILVVHVNPQSRYDDLRAVCSRHPQLSVYYPNDGDVFSC